MSDLPFEGIKVLEVATFIAAPVAGTILGDLGADVIKIEPPGEGDPYRAFPDSPTLDPVDVNYTWLLDARGKRSVTLNLKTDSGIEILKQLIRQCDVYITNQPLPVRERFGLTYDELAQLNERMIYASLTSYGEVGPDRDRPAFDQVAYWARSGLLDLMRAPGTVPAQGLAGMGDHPTGVTLYAAIMTALFRRERTGKGGLVHTSLHANGIWSNSCMGSAALAGVDLSDRRDPTLKANRPRPALMVLYPGSDGRFVQLNMVRNDDQVAALFRVLGLTHLLADSRFATADDRLENGSALSVEIASVVSSRPAGEWIRLFNEQDVPATPVLLTEEIAQDQQAIQNEILLDATDANLGMKYIINHPIRLGDVTGRGAVPAPDVGEHCNEVLAELGYSAEQIEKLRQDGVL